MRPLIGLTGGIGSGKTQAARLFAQRGIDWVDADLVAREVVEPGEPSLDAIVEVFGSEALDPEGCLNRAWLRQQVFADKQLRLKLESITHPAIRARLLEKIHAFDSVYGLLVTPLLFETDQHRLVDASIVVDVPESLQMERAACRDNVSPEHIRSIMGAQMPRYERLEKADFVLDNSKDLVYLEEQVSQLHDHLVHDWI